MQSDAGCAVVAAIGEGEAPLFSEQATYARRAVDALCEQGWPSSRLCGVVQSERGCSVAQVSHRSDAHWIAIAFACALVACALALRRRQSARR